MIEEETRTGILERMGTVEIVRTLDLRVVNLSKGFCEARAPRQTCFLNAFGAVHGGILQAVADTTAWIAILTGTGHAAHIVTTDMNIRFLVPCEGDVAARARVIRFGRTMYPVAVDLFDPVGTHVAVSHVNYMLLDGSPRPRGS